MKKIISLALAMVFVLIATLSVSAASIPTDEQVNNDATASAKWIAKNGNACFGYDPAIAGEFYMIGDANAVVWNWFAVSKSTTAAEGGKITAKLSTKADVGIMFGATALSTSSKLSNGNCDGLQFYYAGIQYDAANSAYSIILLNDSSATGKSEPASLTQVASAPITGVNDADGITLEVAFTADGEVKISANGTEVINQTGLVPYGNECGILAPKVDYKVTQNMAGLELVFALDEFTISALPADAPEAPENGDATALYVVLSAVALCATFAVALSRKKRIEE